MRFHPASSALAAIALAGCAGAPAPPTRTAEPLFVASASFYAPPPRDRAQVIFLAPGPGPEAAPAAGLFDIDGERRTLLAAMGAHTSSLQLLAPGHHVFMSWGGTAHLVAADLAAGRRYYVLMRPVGDGDLQPLPLRVRDDVEPSIANPTFHEWVDSPLVDKTPAADAWFARDAARIDAAQRAALDGWGRLPAAQRAALTLDADDAALR